MNRRDLELIARALRDARPLANPNHLEGIGRHNVIAAQSAVDGVARNLADEIAARHPKFDRAKFLAETGFTNRV